MRFMTRHGSGSLRCAKGLVVPALFRMPFNRGRAGVGRCGRLKNGQAVKSFASLNQMRCLNLEHV